MKFWMIVEDEVDLLYFLCYYCLILRFVFFGFRRLQPKSGERRRWIYRYVEIHIKKHGTGKASRNRQVLLERTRFQSTFSLFPSISSKFKLLVLILASIWLLKF